MKFVSVYDEPDAIQVLYDLLLERAPEQSISHKIVPSFDTHREFVASRPYKHWYLIGLDNTYIGAIYISRRNEIGIFLFNAGQDKGNGETAVRMLLALHPGDYVYNVNPHNTRSIRLIEKLGGELLQWTYRLSS